MAPRSPARGRCCRSSRPSTLRSLTRWASGSTRRRSRQRRCSAPSRPRPRATLRATGRRAFRPSPIPTRSRWSRHRPTTCGSAPSSKRLSRTGRTEMLRLPRLRYLQPPSAQEAAATAAEHGERAMLVAGGTDLFPNLKRRQFEPEVLVQVPRLPGIRRENGHFALGATVTLAQAASDPALRAALPGFAQAAGLVSSPPLRNAGTVGGNLCVDTRCNYYNQTFEWRKAVDFCMKKDGEICLVAPGSPRCWAVSSSDTAPVLWSMGATVTLSGPCGERRIPIAGLYQDDGIVYLSKRPDEVLTEIALPPAGDLRSAYLKLR